MKPTAPLTESEALARMTALCSGSEHCCSEIESKLRRLGQEEPAIARIMAHLIEEKYVDEHRFARAYALDKFRYNHWGRVRIAQTMRQLRLQTTDIQYGLGEIPDEEYAQVLEQLLQAKARQTRGRNDYERRGKLIRFALGRGFAMDDILDALRQTRLCQDGDGDNESGWENDSCDWE